MIDKIQNENDQMRDDPSNKDGKIKFGTSTAAKSQQNA